MIDSALLEIRKTFIPELIFGIGSRHLAGQHANNLGIQKPLVVTDKGLLNTPWIEEIINSLKGADLTHALYSEISSNPRDYEVMAGAEMFNQFECDSIIAVGGGSPMDCAKGIGIVVSNGRHILDFEGVDNIDLPIPPTICIPTTAGSSADVSQFAIINDTTRRVKISIVSKAIVPDLALIDPECTTTMPRDITAHTGLDALTHAVEAYCSNAHSPVTDLHALEAVRLIAKWLKIAIETPDDIIARSQIMLGSMYAGIAFSNAILGAVHAMAHSLGGLMDLPHGLCNAILLNHVVAYNYAPETDRYIKLAQALGAELDSNSPNKVVKAALLERLSVIKEQAGVTITLGDIGVKEEHLLPLARHALEDACMITNPRHATLEDIIEIFKKAL